MPSTHSKETMIQLASATLPVTLGQNPDRWKLGVKRLLDLGVSAGLLLTALPLLPMICVVIKLDSPGPLIFSHDRIGMGGQPFRFYKFRTMIHHSAALAQWVAAAGDDLQTEQEIFYKLRNDPRVTKVGKWLRKTSLDELPQLVNVLKGEMSLVGPRPIVPEEIARYGMDFGDYVTVRPGITGLWQVSGRNQLTYPQRVALNQQYIRNWSLWLDLTILWRTVGAVLSRRGAY